MKIVFVLQKWQKNFRFAAYRKKKNRDQIKLKKEAIFVIFEYSEIDSLKPAIIKFCCSHNKGFEKVCFKGFGPVLYNFYSLTDLRILEVKSAET